MTSQPGPVGTPGARPRRPASVTTAVVLLIVSSVLWLPVVGALDYANGLVELLLVGTVVFAVLALRGRPSARIVVTVTVVLLLFFLLPYTWLGFSDPEILFGPEYAVLDIVTAVAAVAGVVLLYLPVAGAYFRSAATQSR
jgi:hypothetical protein